MRFVFTQKKPVTFLKRQLREPTVCVVCVCLDATVFYVGCAGVSRCCRIQL